MSKKRLIKRLEWYYPLEKLHTFVTFPGLIVYLLFTNPVSDLILLIYGLLVCIIILYQGQLYWKLKLQRLKREKIDQEKHLQFFSKSKKQNVILFLLMPSFLFIQLYILDFNVSNNKLFFWGILANLFAILEHINYYHIQLMVDNEYDMKYIMRNKRLKKASLAKDMAEHCI